MSTHPLILYSNTSVENDWVCPRKRYWSHEFQGVGLETEGTPLNLFLGIVLHDGLAAIASGVDIDAIANAAVEQVKQELLPQVENEADSDIWVMEQATLVEGLLRGFHYHQWPRIVAQYPEAVAIEREMLFKHGPEGYGDTEFGEFGFMTRQDHLRRDKEGGLWYFEYKSTSSNKEAWVNSWSTAVQLHSSVRALEQNLGEKVTGIIVQGLYKGYVSYGKLTSPFCYGYFKPGDPPFTTDKWSYEYKAGWKKYPTWERPGGVKEWIKGMSQESLSQQFPQTPPIFLNDQLIDAFFRQRAEREREISVASAALRRDDLDYGVRQVVMDTSFQQKFKECSPAWGDGGCAFKRLCHSRAGEDPLSNGFKLRDLSHRLVYEGQ